MNSNPYIKIIHIYMKYSETAYIEDTEQPFCFILDTARGASDACFLRNGVSKVTREQYFVLSAANSFMLFIFPPLFPVPSSIRGTRRKKIRRTNEIRNA
jgi:hypothetical protein